MGFEIEPGLPHPSDIVFLPGNQRIRMLDFGRRSSRVFLKVGFDPRTMHNEIAVRTSFADPSEAPFPLISRHSTDGLWFEEPLLEGYSLPRCPPWRSRRHYEHQALGNLDRWLARSTSSVAASAHLAVLADRARHRAQELGSRILSLVPELFVRLIDQLAERAVLLDTIEVAQCHGDLQPGNIFVDTSRRQALLIDWEFSGIRYRDYDFFTYGLGLRAPSGLAQRLNAYVNRGSLRSPTALPSTESLSRRGRAAILAMVLIEDVEWQLAQVVGSDLRKLPTAFEALGREIEIFLSSGHAD
jgi:hypothetical protein